MLASHSCNALHAQVCLTPHTQCQSGGRAAMRRSATCHGTASMLCWVQLREVGCWQLQVAVISQHGVISRRCTELRAFCFSFRFLAGAGLRISFGSCRPAFSLLALCEVLIDRGHARPQNRNTRMKAQL